MMQLIRITTLRVNKFRIFSEYFSVAAAQDTKHYFTFIVAVVVGVLLSARCLCLIVITIRIDYKMCFGFRSNMMTRRSVTEPRLTS